jgi:hypothetical protein
MTLQIVEEDSSHDSPEVARVRTEILGRVGNIPRGLLAAGDVFSV